MILRTVRYGLGAFIIMVMGVLLFGASPAVAQYGCDNYEVGTNYSETICPTSSDASDTTTTDSAEAQDATALTPTDDDIVVTQTEVNTGHSSSWGISWLITILIIATLLGLWWLIAFWRRRKDDEDQHKPTP